MTISHHSHSGQFCLHAKGTLEEVVLEAIRRGFTTFGLSEHVPRYREQDLYPEEEHLRVEDLTRTFEAYLTEAWRLKQLYSDRICLLVGAETEFIDDDGLRHLEALLEQHSSRIQYLVGSVHHCHEHPIDFDKERFDRLLTTFDGDEDDRFITLFSAYLDAQYELMRRLRPEVIGHFDLCRLYYPDRSLRQSNQVWKKVERNIAFAVGYGALFEINASAFRKGWSTAYPGIEIFDAIQAAGGRFTLSDDSHGPQAVALHYDKAYEYMEQQDLDRLWELREVDDQQQIGRTLKAVEVSGKPWLGDWINTLQE